MRPNEAAATRSFMLAHSEPASSVGRIEQRRPRTSCAGPTGPGRARTPSGRRRGTTSARRSSGGGGARCARAAAGPAAASARPPGSAADARGRACARQPARARSSVPASMSVMTRNRQCRQTLHSGAQLGTLTADRRSAMACCSAAGVDGARRAGLVDEAAARLVVAAVGPEEALVRARELLGAVDAERLDLLVGGAAAALLLQPVRVVVVRARAARRARDLGEEALRVLAEGRVEQPISTARRVPMARNGAEVSSSVSSAPMRRGSR